ncbi:N-acetylglucosamine-6-phosphate deacetylase [Aquibacillus halophilus]|uniref:N-acetylglucosamine-6-phosphate deacetylase n=1 Tax=Aquibacillus halophilus TaxID=930132 RepID=A0A6A8DHU0_9BACI|nr:N-acetylglucosamine-6-phosphate deacetylase [Aquibacillus halophilus]MRH43301.1 N-acetylglucosamine-6-phosphate deacetylase [Aquibacillus halophilus]
MSQYFIKAKEFWLEEGVKQSGYLEVVDGLFGGYYSSTNETDLVWDMSDYIIAPGLFDTHIHGIKGYDVMDGTIKSIHVISNVLAELGVTRFLPTTLTSSVRNIDQALRSVYGAIQEGVKGAKIEGIFLEGPYFTEVHKGAQNPKYFLDPKAEDFYRWQVLAGGNIKKIALAPEKKGSSEFIETIKKDNLTISIAHTDASFEICKQAIDKGVSVFVHLFNGMRGLHHRDPGVVGAALRFHDTYSELICDGYHVNPDLVHIVNSIKGSHLVLVTDCMRAGLLSDGIYQLGEYNVTITNGKAETEFGSLAGSTLLLKDSVKNLSEWADISLYEAWHRASLSPAKSMNMDDRIGSIKRGKLADFVAIDKDLAIKRTFINGEPIYQKE